MNSVFFEIEAFHQFLAPRLARKILSEAIQVSAVDGLCLTQPPSGLEATESLQFLCDVYLQTKSQLKTVLRQRAKDRDFLDERVAACYQFNKERSYDITNPHARSVIGLEDGSGRVVFGPLQTNYFTVNSSKAKIAPLPDWLQGPHVTLFGPPDNAKMAINAMNSFHRKLKSEPPIVEELLAQNNCSPFWGADDEDSKTPLHVDLVAAGENLTACFKNTLCLEEGPKRYSLAKDHLAKPLKRFAGLALPASFAFYKKNPLPLHLYDFALHVFHNWDNPQALAFYVPKLENEEEAAYIHHMIQVTEVLLKKLHPQYVLGTIRVMVVLENPRAILRLHEIMDSLYPYFAGASLGWHDYLASTARIFKNDGRYRIPVKADPEIVIKYIKASHHLLADVVGSRGGIKVGGMYGILPQLDELDPTLSQQSFQVTLRGFFKDVITQLKRGLNGFWVAHPDFVRLGLALVKAWDLHVAGDSLPIKKLVEGLLPRQFQNEIEKFIFAEDIKGLDSSDPQFVRSLLVANIKKSEFIANNHPDEIRYNVFQTLQYLTDWLSGRGCVALPTSIDGVAVRVMDDLATAERSRWEVWHELYHGRFLLEDFLVIAAEELHFIRKNLTQGHKSVQVQWNERTAKWYPVAYHLMIKLMTDKNPAEFATELLLPFTVDHIRNTDEPLVALQKIDLEKIRLLPNVERFLQGFEACGSKRWASALSQDLIFDNSKAEALIKSFSFEEIKEAARFHGDIGEKKATLDAHASKEQALVFSEAESLRKELQDLGSEYLNRFGIKFLVSAQGLSGGALLSLLKTRSLNSLERELELAREALWLIAKKRITSRNNVDLFQKIESLRQRYSVKAAGLCILNQGLTQELALGDARVHTHFQIASLSKSIASAVALQYFESKGISLSTSVNQLLTQSGSAYRIEAVAGVDASEVKLAHLISHAALNMHYVNGIKSGEPKPSVAALVGGSEKYSYQRVMAINPPGQKFQYSGGGFLVLEHLLESLESKPIQEIISPYLAAMGLKNLGCGQSVFETAKGYFDDGKMVSGGGFQFPLFAAGMTSDAKTVAQFLRGLELAYKNLQGSAGISHDSAVEMLHGTDRGCQKFMGCLMGLGIFVAEAGPNKMMLHQGSNEGFRALFLHCYAGPDAGKGMVLLCNADNQGLRFIAETAQELLKAFEFQGINFDLFRHHFDASLFSQEQIVNMGYKQLIFSAFEPTLPEKILVHGPVNSMSRFDILSEAKVISVTNQKFARAENLISPFEPTFDPELFGQQGKVMDSWESVRHNTLECDEVVFELQKPSSVNYIFISTKFHDGNQAEFVRILGLIEAKVEIDAAGSEKWIEILPKVQMLGHSFRKIRLASPTSIFSRIKIQMQPDGGLTRVGLYREFSILDREGFEALEKSKCVRFAEAIPKAQKPLSLSYVPAAIDKNKTSRKNLASLAEGAKMLSATNEHYGPAIQLLSPFAPLNMFDGIESARSRKPGHFEEVIVALSEISTVSEVVLDFKYFVNNNPLFVEIEALSVTSGWVSLVKKTQVKAFAGNQKSFFVSNNDQFTQIRLKTLPDGGINRLFVYE